MEPHHMMPHGHPHKARICKVTFQHLIRINSWYTSTPWQHKNPNENVFASTDGLGFGRCSCLRLKVKNCLEKYPYPIQGIYRVNHLSEGWEPDFSATSITDGFCARIGLHEKNLKRPHLVWLKHCGPSGMFPANKTFNQIWFDHVFYRKTQTTFFLTSPSHPWDTHPINCFTRLRVEVFQFQFSTLGAVQPQGTFREFRIPYAIYL